MRDIALAAIFRKDETDAFFVAFTIPTALRHLLGEGAVSRAVVPVLSRKLARGDEAGARAFFLRVRGVSGAVLLIVTVLGMVFAEPLTDLLAAGYRARPGEFERTVDLTRTLFPFLFLTGSVALGASALHLKKRYGFAVLAPFVLNAAFLAAMIAMPGILDARGLDRAQAIAVGALVGGTLQVAAQLYALRKAGFGGQAVIDLRDPGVREVGLRIAPLALGIVVYYVDLIISRRLLSDLESGAQSWFSWAMRICEVTQGFFAIAVATTAISGTATEPGAAKQIAAQCSNGVRLALFASIPVSVALVALPEPIVIAIFQRGEFDANSAVQTARALVWQGGAIWAIASVRHLVRGFYALNDTRTPLLVSILGVIVFVALALGLRGTMGHTGISAALGGSGVVQVFVLFIALRVRLPSLDVRAIAVSAVRAIVAAALAATGGASVALMLAAEAGAGGIARAIPGVAGTLTFAAAFIGVAWALRSPELASITAKRRGR